jgi:hypothetical protein
MVQGLHNWCDGNRSKQLQQHHLLTPFKNCEDNTVLSNGFVHHYWVCRVVVMRRGLQMTPQTVTEPQPEIAPQPEIEIATHFEKMQDSLDKHDAVMA